MMISEARHGTKRGHKHLTKHAIEVLEDRVQHDDATMVAAMMQSYFGNLRTPS